MEYSGHKFLEHKILSSHKYQTVGALEGNSALGGLSLVGKAYR